MRDKKDHATCELPGFGLARASEQAPLETKRASAARLPKFLAKQHQLALFEATDATGLPVWRREDNIDLTGLPIWAAA